MTVTDFLRCACYCAVDAPELWYSSPAEMLAAYEAYWEEMNRLDQNMIRIGRARWRWTSGSAPRTAISATFTVRIAAE